MNQFLSTIFRFFCIEEVFGTGTEEVFEIKIEESSEEGTLRVTTSTTLEIDIKMSSTTLKADAKMSSAT